MNIDEPGRLGISSPARLPSLTLLRRKLIETSSVRRRLEALIRELLQGARGVWSFVPRFTDQVQAQVSQNQREYLLREQMRPSRRELGESDDTCKRSTSSARRSKRPA